MKAALYDVKGSKKGDIALPALFETAIREDLPAKYFESDKFEHMQHYSSYEEAGKRHSASGTISHRRHEWKGHYGKGISRIPRKVMWRRGVQFNWVAAEVSNARGGRRAHPPKGIPFQRKINKQEQTLAMNIAFAASVAPEVIRSRYASLVNVKQITLPAVIESLPAKTKELRLALLSVFGELNALVFKQREVRAGKGKSRGRKYKSSAGLLIVTSSKETSAFKGLDVKRVNELCIEDLYPLGRLTLYTQKAIEELGGKSK